MRILFLICILLSIFGNCFIIIIFKIINFEKDLTLVISFLDFALSQENKPATRARPNRRKRPGQAGRRGQGRRRGQGARRRRPNGGRKERYLFFFIVM